jgi:hypothetical protein
MLLSAFSSLRFLINSALREDDLSLLDLTTAARDLEITHFREARTLEEYLSASKLKDRLLHLERQLKARRRQPSLTTLQPHRQDYDSPTGVGLSSYLTVPDLSPIPEYFPLFHEGTHSPLPDVEAVKRASLGSLTIDSAAYSPTRRESHENADFYHSEPETESPEYTRHVRFSGIDDFHSPGSVYDAEQTPESGTQQQKSDWEYKPSAKDIQGGQDTAAATLPSTGGGKLHTGVPQHLRQKRKRLFVMWHSAQCDNDACSCAKMKKLWKHLKLCADNKCKYPHCYSTRVLLTHYRKCSASDCDLCTPVRKQILSIQSKIGK